MAKKKDAAEPSFEESLERLERLANDLENGDLKLEDAIAKYEEGVKLYARCQETLAKAEKKVQMLVRDADGKLSAVPFESEEFSAAETAEESDDTSAEPPPAQPSTRTRKNNLF